MTTLDPFHEYRLSSPAFDSVIATDGRTLTLHATDMAAFHDVAYRALHLANDNGWLVCSIKKVHPGARIAELSISPRR